MFGIRFTDWHIFMLLIVGIAAISALMGVDARMDEITTKEKLRAYCNSSEHNEALCKPQARKE